MDIQTVSFHSIMISSKPADAMRVLDSSLSHCCTATRPGEELIYSVDDRTGGQALLLWFSRRCTHYSSAKADMAQVCACVFHSVPKSEIQQN
jgi:hypothetical protein